MLCKGGVKDEQNLIRRNRKIVVEQKEMNSEIVLYNGAGYTTHVVYIYIHVIYLSVKIYRLPYKSPKNPIP